MLSERMLGSRSFAMGLAIVLLVGTAVFGQERQWTYTPRKDYLAHRDTDELSTKGHYINTTPLPKIDGLPRLAVSCLDGKFDAVVIYTGVLIDSEFGASPRVWTQIDDEKPKSDRAQPELMADSKTLKFNGSNNRLGGIGLLFAKKYIVTVESYGKRVVEVEFDIPSDSSSIQKYCGVEPKLKLSALTKPTGGLLTCAFRALELAGKHHWCVALSPAPGGRAFAPIPR